MHKRAILASLIGLFSSAALAQTDQFRLNQFMLSIDTHSQTIKVRHSSSPDRLLWSTQQHSPFLEAAVGRERVRYDRASFEFRDRIQKRCRHAHVQGVDQNSPNELVIYGSFADCRNLRFDFVWTASSANQLSFKLSLSGDEAFNRIRLVYAADVDENFYGFGEQYFDYPVKGRRLPIWVEEQGLSRGAQPLTNALRLVGAGATAGDWHTTYSYVPFYVSNKSRSLFLKNYEYLVFDFEQDDEVAIEVFSSTLSGRVIHGESPLDIVREFTSYTGRMAPLPEWTQKGAVLRLSGGEAQVRADIAKAQQADIPIAAVWIEDWIGRRQTWLGARLWWNWEPNRDYYPNWEELVQSIGDQGIRVMTYFNPYLADVVESQVSFERRLYREASAADYFVKQPNNRIFTFGAGLFDAAIVDLSNPDAREFLKEIMVEQYQLGVSGWMADFGEALPYDARLASGADPRSYHNQFPSKWAKLNREAMQEAGLGDDAVTFHRSGNMISPRYAKLFWTGDQLTSWDSLAGLGTVVPALTSSGLSGWALNHAEVGGYLSVNLLFARYERDQELFLRWPEISVFTAMLRTHSTNRPEENHQWYTDQKTKEVFARYAQLFKALTPYRQKMMEEAHRYGYPLVRHPMLHFPDDPNVYRVPQQFMFGSDFWIAPVVKPGQTEQEAYLPKGDWIHLWTGEKFNSLGEFVVVDAPLGQPTAFFRSDLEFGYALRKKLLAQGVISN